MVDDRCQRRCDVLEASTNLLHEGGWVALTMREVAARTGVSAGALYQWFEGKDEIYAKLFTARLNRGIAQFEAMPDDLAFDDILASMLRWVRTTWTTLGRWQLDYLEIARGREPGPARSALSEAYRHILEVGSAKLQAAAEREGRRFLDDLDTMHMIWGIAAGIAQRAEILQMETERVDRMMERAVRSLSAGLTESA
ncbi:MAG: TetR/AcrR family transcriptional regulator [Actinomycetota bacterium]|nr:TetR/AcrR family transcriptional regulator [Actinomycetota bacterium]